MLDTIKPFLMTIALAAVTVFVIFRLLPVGPRKFVIGG